MAAKKYTLKYLAEITNSKIIGDESHEISGVNSLDAATTFEASFLANPRYEEAMKRSTAGVICIADTIAPPASKNLLVSNNPTQAFQIIAELFLSSSKTGFKGIHETTVIHPSAKIGNNVLIGPYVVIDENVHIGDETQILPHSYIGKDSSVGKKCIIYSNVSIREKTIVKDNVIIQPGAVIGSCGFGFIQDKNGKYEKLNQIGIVEIEDNVEIGANTTIDRARFDKTKINKGCIIDNLVQVAHNVQIGENTAIAAQTGISGSTSIGKNVILAGQVGIAGHLKIDDYVLVTAQSGVSKSLKSGKYRGSPAIDFNCWNRQFVNIKNIDKLIDKIKKLEKKISELENSNQ